MAGPTYRRRNVPGTVPPQKIAGLLKGLLTIKVSIDGPYKTPISGRVYIRVGLG